LPKLAEDVNHPQHVAGGVVGERNHAELDDLVLGVVKPRCLDVDQDAHRLASN
jgi:hypothetical protein